MDFKTMTPEQIKAALAQAKELNKQIAAARKEGLIAKEPKAVKIKTAEFLLLAGQFKSVIDSNLSSIESAFKASMTTDKPLGNTGINFRVKDENYYVQILSQSAMDAKKLVTDAAKKAAKEVKEEVKTA
jgi:hypothetical protein